MMYKLVAPYVRTSGNTREDCQEFPSEFSRCRLRILEKTPLSEFWIDDNNYHNNQTSADGEQSCDATIGLGTSMFNMVVDHVVYGMSVGGMCIAAVRRDGQQFSDIHTQDSQDYTSEEYILLDIYLDDISHRGMNIIEMTSEEKLDKARILKSSGTSLYKTNREFSFELFSRALKFLLCMEDVGSDEKDRLMLQCYLNLAACQLQSQAYSLVIDNCSRALELEPGSVKALYRRAQAYTNSGRYEQATEDTKVALILEPTNQAIQNLIVTIRRQYMRQPDMVAAMEKMFK